MKCPLAAHRGRTIIEAEELLGARGGDPVHQHHQAVSFPTPPHQCRRGWRTLTKRGLSDEMWRRLFVQRPDKTSTISSEACMPEYLRHARDDRMRRCSFLVVAGMATGSESCFRLRRPHGYLCFSSASDVRDLPSLDGLLWLNWMVPRPPSRNWRLLIASMTSERRLMTNDLCRAIPSERAKI